MAIDVALISFWLSLAFGGVCGVVGGWNLICFHAKRLLFLKQLIQVQWSCLTLALGILGWAYVTCQFSFLNVFSNSHTELSPLFRLGALWGNAEGSLLIGCWVLSGIAFLMTKQAETKPRLSAALWIQSLIVLSFLGFMAITGHPFQPFPLGQIPQQGLSLNPLLHDPTLLTHPPTLYLGYLGFSAPFSWSVAMMFHQDTYQWHQRTRSWTYGALALLTLGIGLGSWWAYQELGWGGWWFWDPVENAALLPWLLGVGMLHMLQAGAQHPSHAFFQKAYVTLSVAAFSLCLMGIYITRAGVLTSVHSFAHNPFKGHLLLGVFLWFSTVGILALCRFLPHNLNATKPLPLFPVSHAASLKVQVFLLTFVAGIVLLWTLFPLGFEWFQGQSINLDPEPLHRILFPFVAVLMLGMGAVPLSMSPQTQNPTMGTGIIYVCLTLTLGAVWVMDWMGDIPSLMALGVLSVGLFGMLGSLGWLIRLFQQRRVEAFGAAIAHTGAAWVLLGVGIASFWRLEVTQILPLNGNMSIGPHTLVLKKVTHTKGNLFDRYQAHLEMTSYKTDLLKPEKRLYHLQGAITSKTALKSDGWGDLYVVLEETFKNQTWQIRVMYLPFVWFIWWGCAMMVAGILYPFGLKIVGNLNRKKRRGTPPSHSRT